MYIAPNVVEYDWSCSLKLETLTTEDFCKKSSSKQPLEITSIKWNANIKAHLRKMNCEVPRHIQLFYMCPELFQILSSGRF